jgi:hypothetical protein
MRFAAPRVPLIFYTTGARRLKILLEEGALRDFDDFQRLVARGVSFPVPPDDKERRAVEASDLIVLHSPHVRVAYEHFYPGYMGKVYDNVVSVADFAHDEAAAFRALARPFAERDIDVIAVASDWERVEKNYPLVRHVAASCPTCASAWSASRRPTMRRCSATAWCRAPRSSRCSAAPKS